MSVRTKYFVEGYSKQVGLGRWVGDSQTVFVLYGDDLAFQALILTTKRIAENCIRIFLLDTKK